MTSRLAIALALCLALLASTSAARTRTGYSATLMPLTASTRADGTGSVFSLNATGDLHGLITVDLDPDGTTGTWTLQASYLQDFFADGTPALTPPLSEEDEAAHPRTTRRMNDGALTGTVVNASISIDASGHKVLTFAQLAVTGGTQKFDGAHGAGTITLTALGDGTSTTTLSLTF